MTRQSKQHPVLLPQGCLWIAHLPSVDLPYRMLQLSHCGPALRASNCWFILGRPRSAPLSAQHRVAASQRLTSSKIKVLSVAGRLGLSSGWWHCRAQGRARPWMLPPPQELRCSYVSQSSAAGTGKRIDVGCRLDESNPCHQAPRRPLRAGEEALEV